MERFVCRPRVYTVLVPAAPDRLKAGLRTGGEAHG